MNMLLEVYVQPGAKKTALSGKHDGRLKIRLNAPPIDGKANQELVTFMAQLLKLKKQEVQIIRGEKSRFKLLSIPTGSDLIEQLKALGVELID